MKNRFIEELLESDKHLEIKKKYFAAYPYYALIEEDPGIVDYVLEKHANSSSFKLFQKAFTQIDELREELKQTKKESK